MFKLYYGKLLTLLQSRFKRSQNIHNTRSRNTFIDHDSTADPLITYDKQFSTKLEEVINTHFLLKVVKFHKHKHKKCKWMTHTLLTEIKKRDELYRSFNSTKPETYKYTVKEAELKIKVKEVRKLKRETKAEYYNLEFNKSKK